ncbi:MAG: GNAT family N-acyltransferase [Acidobacteriota bacterium]
MLPETTGQPSDDNSISTYPIMPDRVPDVSIRQGRYLLTFARDESQLRQVQRLRFQIFNLELGEGLEESMATGLDQDRFDRVYHHLMVLDSTDGSIVGTYRLQTDDMAHSHHGFYSADEFDLSALPQEVLASSVELGRACISAAHRNRAVLFLLWKGLATYMVHNQKRFLFGCSSLTSQDPLEGLYIYHQLAANDHLHPALVVPPQPGYECFDESLVTNPGTETELPKLFRTYLRYGTKICGIPAIDREFKTIDFFMLLDLESLDERRYKLFFQ